MGAEDVIMALKEFRLKRNKALFYIMFRFASTALNMFGTKLNIERATDYHILCKLQDLGYVSTTKRRIVVGT